MLLVKHFNISGLEGVVAFLQEHEAIFKSISSVEGSMWHLCEGVCPLQLRDLSKQCNVSEDFSKYDTPPGQKVNLKADSSDLGPCCLLYI